MGAADGSAAIAVVGAGAAGLWAAERAARAAGGGGGVLLLEKTPRTGTKVLASGGTRCNLTTTLPPDAAARLFGPRGERFLRRAFRELPPSAVRARFAELGVPTVEAPLEKVFPASGRARDVRDALERACAAAGVRTRTGAPVVALEREPTGWVVRLQGGEAARARRLVLAPGGASYPATGTTGDGYAWLAALGLPVVPPVPALVPLASDAPWVRELTGIALEDAVVTATRAGRTVARRRRPVLFTHRGLSGPGAMDVSREVARAVAEGALAEVALTLDLAPEATREELVERLRAAASAGGAPRVSRALDLDLPRRVLAAACAAAGLESDPRANDLPRARRHGLVESLKALRVPLAGTLGFDKAEVTAGGLALSALDPGTLRVRGVPDLWACGELIDLDGPIGGLNFQSAFATAELAGRDAGAPP